MYHCVLHISIVQHKNCHDFTSDGSIFIDLRTCGREILRKRIRKWVPLISLSPHLFLPVFIPTDVARLHAGRLASLRGDADLLTSHETGALELVAPLPRPPRLTLLSLSLTSPRAQTTIAAHLCSTVCRRFAAPQAEPSHEMDAP